MSLHVSRPVGETWKATEATPDPASSAAPEKVFVPVIGEPGSLIVTPVGAALSTRRFATSAEAAEPPASFSATARKS
jgi:hypothetical protein